MYYTHIQVIWLGMYTRMYSYTLYKADKNHNPAIKWLEIQIIIVFIQIKIQLNAYLFIVRVLLL